MYVYNYSCIFSLFFRGYLYWSDWGNNDTVRAHIKRAYFDGSMITTIVTFDMGVVPLGSLLIYQPASCTGQIPMGQ